MGSEPYSYTVEYEEDINAALQKLRQTVFDSGEFRGAENEYRSIDDIFMDFELMEAGGTGSIIEVTSVSNEPDDEPGTGKAVTFSEAELQEVLGTPKPRVDDLARCDELFAKIERGHCRYLVLHDADGTPAKLHFCGYSLD